MPIPEKHIFVCTQSRPMGHPRPSCAQKGCGEVYEEFLWQLQQRNLFNRIQVTATGCLGPCSEGANVLIYPGAVMYGRVTKADVAEIYDQHLLADQPVERLKVAKEFWG